MEKEMRWLDTVYALAKEDAWCQECRKQVEAAEPAFIRLKNRLEPWERDALDRYLSACDDKGGASPSLMYLDYASAGMKYSCAR